MIIRLPIDVKSLYYNIKNDNETGHTATVSTPIRQGSSVDEELVKIFSIPENISYAAKECIIGKLLMKSRAEVKILNVFVFNKIFVNNQEVDGCPSFCLYVREETKKGYVHCGRQKLHYPSTLKYSDNDVEIDNKAVLTAISAKLHNYAFLINAFEYDTCKNTLNFDALIIGPRDIPYSKVFINKRGVGEKFTSIFSEEAESYDSEIIALRQKLGYQNVSPENFNSIAKNNQIKASTLVEEFITKKGAQYIRHITDEYLYALYDFEYMVNDIKYFAIVRFTATKLQYFNLPINKVRFCSDFSSQVSVILVCDIDGSPIIYEYSIKEMNQMSKSINSICYEVIGGNYE